MKDNVDYILILLTLSGVSSLRYRIPSRNPVMYPQLTKDPYIYNLPPWEPLLSREPNIFYTLPSRDYNIYPLPEENTKYHDINKYQYDHIDLLKGLNRYSILELKKEVRALVNDINDIQRDFATGNRTCQRFLRSQEYLCWACAELKCLTRFQTLRCTNQFSIRDGLNRLTTLLQYYFSNVVPSFFTEDLRQYFGNQSTMYFYYYLLFYDVLLHNLPEAAKRSDFSQFFRHEFPNRFLEEDLPDLFLSSFSEYFQSLDGIIKDLKQKHPDENNFQVIKKYIGNSHSRHRRSLLSEPMSCMDIEQNPTEACSYYVEVCPACYPNKNDRQTECPLLAEAHQKSKKLFWFTMASITNGTMFKIHSISNNGIFPMNGVYDNALIDLTIFGKDLTLEIDEPLPTRNMNEAAEIIIGQSLDSIKVHLSTLKPEDIADS